MKHQKMTIGASVLLLLLVFAASAFAALDSVSGLQADGELTEITFSIVPEDIASVAVSLANGFPIWYQQDTTGRKLELCLEQGVQLAGSAPDSLPTFPCLTGEPFPDLPISFPFNFGGGASYWAAETGGTFQSSSGGGDMLLVLRHGAGFFNEVPIDGEQVVASRIRIRVNVPVPGTYRVTHPFGTFDYVVTTITTGREINQTQDVGAQVMQNFLNSLADGPVPATLVDPAANLGVVNAGGLSIGPFLTALNVADELLDVNGNIFLADPGTEDAPLTRAITGAPFTAVGEAGPANYFSLELLNPPDGFFLNGPDGNQIIERTDFVLMGKVFNDGPNLAPVAVADNAVTATNTPVSIDVVTNDRLDPGNAIIPDTNVHGINPQALALVDPLKAVFPFYYTHPSGMPQLTATQLTTEGGEVRRVTNVSNGSTTFLYTPPTDYSGIDTFSYVVQDTGGLISAPATVTILVEDLQVDRADFRVKTGKWQVSGSSSDTTDNSVTIFGSPRAGLSGANEVPQPITTDARGSVALAVAADRIDFVVTIDPLPATAINAIHIHLGVANANGPVLFFLHDTVSQGAFTGTKTGSLNVLNLIFGVVPDFNAAVEQILAGNTYVNVHTTDFPAGEIRGQITQPVIGSADVVAGEWLFNGKSTTSPGLFPSLTIRSVNNIELLNVPLRLR